MLDLPAQLNIAERFLDARVAEGRGERIALRLEGGSLSYRQVQRLANQFALVLQTLGVRQEERVLVALADGADFVAALFGVLKLGAVGVMVNPQLRVEDLAHLLESSRARVVVVDADSLPSFVEARGSRPLPELLVAAELAEGGRSFAELATVVGEELETVATHRDDPALWLFSGGTTGRPKAVVQTHGSFAFTTEAYAIGTLGFRQDDITLAVPKLFFGYSTGANLFFPFAVGASAVLFPQHCTVEALLEQIRRHRPTILINVPKMVNQLIGHPAAERQDLASLRFATSAGEALPESLHRRWRERFGVELLDGLGTAEMWHVFVTNRPGEVRPGTLGRVVDGFEVRVCDEQGAELPDGEVGQLWVRGGARALGYWQDLTKTARCFIGEWFVGGDLVVRDAEGFLTYCGRGDDVLKVGGKWLAPQEVESCLLAHPAVSEVAVVGIPDADGLTKPVAFVVAKELAAGLEEELKAFALQRLDAYKHPRLVVLRPALPRTHLGKVDRGRLKREPLD